MLVTYFLQSYKRSEVEQNGMLKRDGKV